VKIRRPFRAVVNVAVIAAAVGYVVFSASQLPAFNNGTIVGNATAGLFGKARPTGMGVNWSYMTKQVGKWTSIAERDLTDADHSDPARGVVVVSRFFGPSRWGVWHPVLERRHDEVRFRSLVGMKPITDLAVCSQVFEALNGAEGGTPLAGSEIEFYASGGGSTRRILWLGVLGDLSILAAFAAIILSLVKLRREIRWRKPGHCTVCDYDLAGLTADKCPECGAAVTPSKGI